MPHRIIEGEASADWVGDYLQLRSVVFPLSGKLKIGDGVLLRKAYEIVIPRSWWAEALLGDGGGPEPVVMNRWPSGKVELVASPRMLRFIDRELENTRSRI